MSDNVDDELLARVEDQVLWLTLNRPDAGNAITPAVRNRLIEHLSAANDSFDVRAVVLTAAGEKHFCTGADLRRRAERATGRGRAIDGVLVCELVRDGVEMVLGVAQDSLFGPVVMCGLGGVLVEVLEDVSFRVPPFSRDEAARMVGELRGAALLVGVRGAKPADVDALLDAIMNLQRLAMDLAGPNQPDGIAEVDINPLVVRPRGAVALDALVVRK